MLKTNKKRNPYSFVKDFNFPNLKKRSLKNINILNFQLKDLVEKIEGDIDEVASGNSNKEKLTQLKNNLKILDRLDQDLPLIVSRLKGVE